LLPFFVVDARLAETLMGKSTVTAASLNINPILIPAHPVTTVLGAQVYVLRRPGFAVGIGGEFVHLHIVNQPVDATTGLPLGTAIERHFSSASPQLTFNFGRKRGWSYLSVGEAPISFDTYFVGNTPDGLRPVTLNYGGGGRWFSTKHVAYSVDLHFYATKPATPTLIVGQRARQTVIFFSMGISIR
jgi:hypothetical protein